MNTIAENVVTWDRQHQWSQHGDEWNGMAAYCHQPYAEWKQALIDTFITPYVGDTSRVVEIAPGHGRWSETLVAIAGHATLIDVSPSCVEYCRERFGERPNVTVALTDGKSLPGVDDQSVDFVWSFDSFVHMDAQVIAAYLSEIRRVLATGGTAVIHHAGRRGATLPFAPVRTWGRPGRLVYALASEGRTHDGWRSDVSKELFALMATAAGLRVKQQTQTWGAHQEYTVRRFNDWVTVLER